uniref:Uncharacterized protein n=1 Tax=Trieres chinensis TaxID=1514140 RepID=A0A7S1ZIR2_TRICV|mmetsp:Transcript_26135/g.53517  ORF Transcript_26135/g.53517 Transcript_26135/m.53517 type:complete len:216 (+) Transcript_26135:165-812(+)|eukprot:CAMPEP_0183309266 /NCGR_PEP_ID=MMETSP0160_2-20130417/24741_1 /TAXON_ID=2839 ORGANISM="Odontella Sinensis, Strain Grunow 1884" /NCGR_SAMPLE_ID=MMETSP0160_2 /ASSEMBLY_ACC=CAM_ASM_000250 /LENGTH=215 /DNA_ID=CAMNT_0025473265 /DNA_START=116 /DNA_END=763 /DNA_ORIENTATION=+
MTLLDSCGDDACSLVRGRNNNSAVSPSTRFYDPCSTLLISRQLADGYLILLSGGIITAAKLEKTRKRKCVTDNKSSDGGSEPSGEPSSQESDVPETALFLAFASITDGNVIDSTFGVRTVGGGKRSKDTSSYAFNAAQAAKEMLREAAESSESVAGLAVETYKKCFEIILDYNDKLDGLGFITWCYRHQAIEKDALDDLEENFQMLAEAVEASTA